MDQYPVEFIHKCDYSGIKAINTLLNQDKFNRVREKIRDKTPFGDLLQMDHKPSIQKCVARNAVKGWNVESGKLVIGDQEYGIDSELVKKSLSLSITGDKIIKPRDENKVPSFIEQAIPNLIKDNRKFHLQVIDIFQSKDVEVIGELQVVKLSKLYIAVLFSALLFPKRQRIPLEYFYLLDDDHRFENLKLYRFDIEVAKFLKEGILTAKKAKCRCVTVSGCLHILECLYSQDKLPMIHSPNKRERKEDEVEPAFKRPRNSIGNCSKDYPVKTEPQSENPKIEIIDIDDDSSEEDAKDEDYDEELDRVPLQYFMNLKRETLDKVASPLEYTSSGQPFSGHHSSGCVVLNDEKCENVEGFSVLKTQAKLYKKIWSRHGHIASSKVLTDPYAQVPVVSGIMTTITEMHDTRFCDLNSEMIEAWEKNIMNGEKVEFNVQWARNWLEEFKKEFFVKEKLVAELTEHDDLLKEEEKKCVAAKNAQKEAEYKIVALKSNMNPLIKEKRKYDEKESCLLSEWWLQ